MRIMDTEHKLSLQDDTLQMLSTGQNHCWSCSSWNVQTCRTGACAWAGMSRLCQGEVLSCSKINGADGDDGFFPCSFLSSLMS